MYKFLLLILLAISCSVYSQTSTDSADLAILQKYKTLIKSDSAQNAELLKVENGIQRFYEQNRKSQGFIYFGIALAYTGVLLTNYSSDENYLIVTAAGSVFSLIGTIIGIDSYKHLNVKPRPKPKPKEPFNYVW